MAVVSDQTIASAALAAGFPRDQIPTAVAVALAESGGDATARNTSNSDGSVDHGLWQINSVHAADLAAGNWRDPFDNARMAHAVWSRAGRKWTPWVAWDNGLHLPFLARGTAAMRALDDSGATSEVVNFPDPFGAVDQVQELAGLAGGALDVLTDRDLWVRIGIGAVGAVLLAVALAGLVWTLGGKKQVERAIKILAPTGKAKALKGATK